MSKNNMKEIRAFWGESLVKLPHTTVNSLPIDNATKQFLIDVGLPRQVNIFPDEDLTLEFCLDSPLKINTYKDQPVTLIGQMGEDGIYIYITFDGSIFNRVVLGDNDDQWRFMNSTLEQFLTFISIFKRLYPEFWFRPDIDDLDDEEQEEKLAQLAADFQAQFEPYDSKAFENDETWWSVAFEQIEDGFW